MRHEKGPAGTGPITETEARNSHFTVTADNGKAPDDVDIIRLISTNPRAWQVWLHGFEYGLIHGAEQQRQDDNALADLAARIAIARVEHQGEIRETIRHAIKWIDVEAARNAAGSAYVPGRGEAS